MTKYPFYSVVRYYREPDQTVSPVLRRTIDMFEGIPGKRSCFIHENRDGTFKLFGEIHLKTQL